MFGFKVSEKFEWMVCLWVFFFLEWEVMNEEEKYYFVIIFGLISVGGKIVFWWFDLGFVRRGFIFRVFGS